MILRRMRERRERNGEQKAEADGGQIEYSFSEYKPDAEEKVAGRQKWHDQQREAE